MVRIEISGYYIVVEVEQLVEQGGNVIVVNV